VFKNETDFCKEEKSHKGKMLFYLSFISILQECFAAVKQKPPDMRLDLKRIIKYLAIFCEFAILCLYLKHS